MPHSCREGAGLAGRPQPGVGVGGEELVLLLVPSMLTGLCGFRGAGPVALPSHASSLGPGPALYLNLT